MLKRKNHGERNKNLSKELFDKAQYLDWAITTAFYSAIHFVEDKILPCQVQGQHCTNIDDVKKAYSMRGRHAARERLVSDHLELKVAVRYKWLDDKSRYARYTTYKITKSEAEKAQLYLKSIHEACYS